MHTGCTAFSFAVMESTSSLGDKVKDRYYLGKEENWALSQLFGCVRFFQKPSQVTCLRLEELLMLKEERLSQDQSGKSLELGSLAVEVIEVPSRMLSKPNTSGRRSRHLPSIPTCQRCFTITGTVDSPPKRINTGASADHHNQAWYMSSHSQPGSRCLSLILSQANKPLIKRRGEKEVRFLRQHEWLSVAGIKIIVIYKVHLNSYCT